MFVNVPEQSPGVPSVSTARSISSNAISDRLKSLSYANVIVSVGASTPVGVTNFTS